MVVLEGRSNDGRGEAAVLAATAAWPEGACPDVVFVFASPLRDVEACAVSVARRFPMAHVVGCSTAGEQVSGVLGNGGLALAALCESEIAWASVAIDDLRGFGAESAAEAVAALFGVVGVDASAPSFDPDACLAFLFVDGLARREEAVTAALADALGGVRLVGGSAGDDLAFQRTEVIHGPRVLTGGAVVLLGFGPGRFDVLKHQHFTVTPTALVVTRVDPAARRVYELDGTTALVAFARALRLPPVAVTPEVVFEHPLAFRCLGEIYVRSIQKVEDDGSLTFFCAVDEGMVLEIVERHDMPRELARAFETFNAGRGEPEFLLTFNCILRAIEARKQGCVAAVGGAIRGASASSIGFDTYGEQFDGLHINQTLVAAAIRAAG